MLNVFAALGIDFLAVILLTLGLMRTCLGV